MKKISNILYISDPGSECLSAFKRAVNLAYNNQAKLTVVDVVNEKSIAEFGNDEVFPLDSVKERIIDRYSSLIDQLAEPLQIKNNFSVDVLVGTPFIEIIRKVIRDKHDLVIKMVTASTLKDRFFGSEDMHLLRKCPSPVWLFKSDSGQCFERILAAVDVDDVYPDKELIERQSLNKDILGLAMSLAISDSSELQVAAAWESVGENYMRVRAGLSESEVEERIGKQEKKHRENLDELVASMNSDSVEYTKPKKFLLKGSPKQQIPEFVEKNAIDLVVMGTVARTGIPGFIIGNTAETILNEISCSVLAIKPQGFESPVKLAD